jgi:hypothetical protein
VLVRFRNNGGKAYARPELHLVYETKSADDSTATFAWTDDTGPHTHREIVKGARATWTVPTGKGTRTKWVEFAVGQ